MLKEVKEGKEKLEGRDLLEQINLKHFGFSILLVVVVEMTLHLIGIYSGKNTN